MAETGLTPQEAHTKIGQVDQAMQSAHQCVRNMQDHTHQMTGSTWRGNQAQQFGLKMQHFTDDMTTVVNHLQQLADNGKANMTALINLEHE